MDQTPSLAKYIPLVMGKKATPWYLAGKILRADCLGAWQGIGAASYAASKVNLANPGTYDLTSRSTNEFPLWSSYDGWIMFGGWDQHLDTGITNIADAYTIVVRFSECAGDQMSAFGLTSAGQMFFFPNRYGSTLSYHGSSVYANPRMTSGVFAIAGTNSYRNGTLDSALGHLAGTVTGTNMKIGEYQGVRPGSDDCRIKVQAFAMYSRALTAPENLAVAAAMAALPNGSYPYVYDEMVVTSSIGR
jgi:hypothetical protein